MYNTRGRNDKASNVAHNWANQLPAPYKKDHTAGSLYFEGKTIYSYGRHFPIATLCTNKAGKTVVLFTTRGYSNTTSKHISIVRQACSQFELVYCYNPKEASEGYHTNNLSAFETAAKNNLPALEKAKKPELYLNAIAYQKELAIKYAECFGILKSKEFKALSYIHIESKDGGTVASEKERKAKEKAAKEAEKRRIIQHEKDLIKEAEGVRKFRSFKPGFDRLYSIVSGLSYLRFNKDTQRIETSQRVEIPVKIAERAYKWIIKTHKNGGCVEGGCGGYKILDFEVKSVTTEQVRIGCHLLTIDEVLKIGKICKF